MSDKSDSVSELFKSENQVESISESLEGDSVSGSIFMNQASLNRHQIRVADIQSQDIIPDITKTPSCLVHEGDASWTL